MNTLLWVIILAPEVTAILVYVGWFMGKGDWEQ